MKCDGPSCLVREIPVVKLVQVGAGSGGMAVVDLVSRDSRVAEITLIEPDIYKNHNIVRHYFGPEAVGRPKVDLAVDWLQDFRPDLKVNRLAVDVMATEMQPEIEAAVANADVGVCAVDSEPAKYHWDSLMRKHRKPWTLGEVLSGGIGGFVHWFHPEGPCYGCVASYLQRAVEVEKPSTPDYSQPGGPVEETAIPASKASIHAIAALHAVLTLQLIDQVGRVEPGGDLSGWDPGFTSLLMTLEQVPDIFETAFQPHRLQIPRSTDCLICRTAPASVPPAQIDEELNRALERLGSGG